MNNRLLQDYQVNILTEVIYVQLLPEFKKEIEQFNDTTISELLRHLKYCVAGRLVLLTIDDFDLIVARVKRDIDPITIIADIIL